MTEKLPVTLVLALAEAQHEIVAGQPIETQLRATMQSTRNHWMCTNEDEQFRAAVGAVMQHYGVDSIEYNRLAWEMRQIARFSAMISAAQVGLGITLEDEGEPAFEPIGLLGMWRETR